MLKSRHKYLEISLEKDKRSDKIYTTNIVQLNRLILNLYKCDHFFTYYKNTFK